MIVFALLVILALQIPSTKQAPKQYAETISTVAKVPKPEPTPKKETPVKVDNPVIESPPTQPITVAAAGGPKEWMDAAGIAESDRRHVTAIMGQESGWTLNSTNSIGCIGLGQACPSGNKAEMLATCPDWETNGGCQMKVWVAYMQRRYGSWAYAEEWKFCKFICYNAHDGITRDKNGEPWW